jgi:hypothetical protein
LKFRIAVDHIIYELHIGTYRAKALLFQGFSLAKPLQNHKKCIQASQEGGFRWFLPDSENSARNFEIGKNPPVDCQFNESHLQ